MKNLVDTTAMPGLPFIAVVAMKRPRPVYNIERLIADMTLRGWNDRDLARQADLSVMTVKRFLDRDTQTAKTADRLARALGYTVKRYLSHVEQVA